MDFSHFLGGEFTDRLQIGEVNFAYDGTCNAKRCSVTEKEKGLPRSTLMSARSLKQRVVSRVASALLFQLQKFPVWRWPQKGRPPSIVLTLKSIGGDNNHIPRGLVSAVKRRLLYLGLNCHVIETASLKFGRRGLWQFWDSLTEI